MLKNIHSRALAFVFKDFVEEQLLNDIENLLTGATGRTLRNPENNNCEVSTFPTNFMDGASLILPTPHFISPPPKPQGNPGI
jgi:hypothetical protein